MRKRVRIGGPVAPQVFFGDLGDLRLITRDKIIIIGDNGINEC
jgi:hypothetical protein